MRNSFLDVLDPQLDTGDQPATFWATVVGTSPLRIQRDSELTLPVTPKTLEAVQVGDRVLCLWERRQVIILGRMGGVGGANSVVIDGTEYERSGSVAVPSFSWTKFGEYLYVATVGMPVPYAPPDGWTFAWSMQQTSGFSFASPSNPTVEGGRQPVRLLQLNSNSTTAIQRLQWQLVKA